MLKQYLEAGKIVGTHGIKGELRVEPWCDSAEFLKGFSNLYWNEGREKLEVVSSRVHKTLLLLQLKGIDTVEQADTLRGRILFIDRRDVELPEGHYFMQDMIGLSVEDADTGNCYGNITEVLRTGANDVYQVTALDGKEYLLPAVPHMIIETDLDKGILRVRPIKGIFDDAD